MAKILLIGNGAREHAIAWKIKASPLLTGLWMWPDHPACSSLINTPTNLGPTATHTEIADFCKMTKIDAVIVGPEQPLSTGLANILENFGIPCFGPQQDGAQLESSKSFAKDIMTDAKIPTAFSREVKTETQCRKEAIAILKTGKPVVLKASGLAGGKGVFVCFEEDEVEVALIRLYENMSEAAETVLVEDFLEGRECSFFCLIGKDSYTPLGFAVDYKRLQNGDEGPNTGGMGSYTPVSWLPADAQKRVLAEVVEPLLKTLKYKAIPYTGFLYVGLMWHPKIGPQVVEFNCRLGDPEAQILAVADQRDWLAMILKHLGLHSEPLESPNEDLKPTAGVVMSSLDYPYGEGKPGRSAELPLELFAHQRNRQVFAASVKFAENHTVETGKGRVITCVATAEDLDTAAQRAYHLVETVQEFWPDSHFREDIAQNHK